MSILPERVENLDANVAQYLKPCMKKPIPVKAVQMTVYFQVETLEGNYKQGKPGDYLMCGVFGELYICDKDVFEASYNWL